MNIHSPPEGTRDAILVAALDRFCEQGFDGTSVPDIARAAGLAAGTMYRHFASKRALVNALYCHHKQALMLALLDEFPFDCAPREQFAALWGRLAGFARAQPQAFAFLELHHHARYLDDESLALEREALAPVAAFFDRPDVAAVVRPMPVPALIALVWGAFVGLVKASRAGYLELSDAVLAQAEDACWSAMTASAE